MMPPIKPGAVVSKFHGPVIETGRLRPGWASDNALRCATIAMPVVLAASLCRAHAATFGFGPSPAISIWHAPLIAHVKGTSGSKP
jgi:hypothetical protein